MNRNVKVALAYTAALSTCSGIWGYSVLSGYLKELGGSNIAVGLAEGIQGTVQAVAALPAGIFADRGRRDRVLRFAAGLGVAAFASLLLSLILGQSDEYVAVCVSLGVVGAYNGATNAPLEALFADSVSMQDRPRLTTYKFVARILGTASGPLTSLALFRIIGDEWTLGQQRTVMIIGSACSIFPALLLLLFSDRAALGSEADAVASARHSASPENASAVGVGTMSMNQQPLLDAAAASGSDENTVELGHDDELHNGETQQQQQQRRRTRFVPFVCAVSDVVFALASGMTIKFFPLFFKDEAGLSPSWVNGIYFITPFTPVEFARRILLINLVTPHIIVNRMAAASLAARRLSATFGRVWVIVVTKVAGISLLFAMWAFGMGYDERVEVPPLWGNVGLIVPVYILRTVLMNCTSPLKKSILNDFVPVALLALARPHSSNNGPWSLYVH